MKRGRPKKPNKYIQTAFKLPPDLLEAVDSYIESTTMNRSLFVRQAIIEYFERRDLNPNFTSMDEKKGKANPPPKKKAAEIDAK